MSIVIQLDVPTLNALFPEGSEARIKIQNAVLHNFIDGQIKKAAHGEIKELIERNIRDLQKSVIETVVRDYCDDIGKSTYNPEFTLKKILEEAMLKKGRLVAHTIVQETSAEVIRGIESRITDMINHGELAEEIHRRIASSVRREIFNKLG